MDNHPRLAVISGGGTGNGKVLARKLAEDGDRVVIVGRRTDVLESAAEGINAHVGAAVVSWQSADLTQPSPRCCSPTPCCPT